jgi:hypothetical protein
MKKVNINIDHIQGLAKSLDHDDLNMLVTVVDYLGEIPGLQARLLVTLDRSYDHDRAKRIQTIVRKLNDAEVIWLCDNADSFSRQE